MRSMLRNEFPSDVLGGEEASHSILGLLTLQEMVKFLISRAAPTKLIPQSLQMSEGQSQQALNLLRQT